MLQSGLDKGSVIGWVSRGRTDHQRHDGGLTCHPHLDDRDADAGQADHESSLGAAARSIIATE